MVFATLASQDVASVLLPVIPSSRLRFFKEGGVTDSMGGMISLSELKHSGSSKNSGLYSISAGLEGHGPESYVTLTSFFLGDKTPGSFLGLFFPSFTGFFHGLNSSVHFSMSSTKVWLPVLVLTFTTRSTASSVRSHVQNPLSKSHLNSSDLAMFSKIYIEHNIIASCLLWA